MFDALKDKVKQLQMMQRLMKDEQFRALITHPKVQELLKDPEFQRLVSSKEMSKIIAHPKLASLMRDPELAPLLMKLDPKKFLQA